MGPIRALTCVTVSAIGLMPSVRKIGRDSDISAEKGAVLITENCHFEIGLFNHEIKHDEQMFARCDVAFDYPQPVPMHISPILSYRHH